MIRLLLEARDTETGEALNSGALRNEAAVIFMAGHETTANALAWTWYLLSHVPEVEERLHAELKQVLGARPPTLDDVPQLVYTRALLEEAIRLYPPVPILGRQALRDEAIRGRKVPAGSLVVVVPWLLHRHRRYWGKPDHFIPERFLPENAGCASGTPISHSAPGRASVPAPRSASPRRSSASRHWRSAPGFAWHPAPLSRQCAG